MVAKAKSRAPKTHNLGGVRFTEPGWKALKTLYQGERRLEETFADYVRRMLLRLP